MADVVLAKHQSDATRLLASSVTNGWPIVMVECESKLSGEKMQVLAVSLINLDNNDHILVPLARLFEEPPMDLCYTPKLQNVDAVQQDVLNEVYGAIKGWKLTVKPIR